MLTNDILSQPKGTCPKCGTVPLENITVYNETLRKQTFNISPILPTCNTCNSEVEVKGCAQDVKIILLNGTCGSGKSSTAEELVKSHGFLAIDSDCAMQVIKHKLGVKHVDFDSNELFEEICKEIDILSAFGSNIVLSHIVMPADIPKYIRLFKGKGMAYRIILLKPSYKTAVERTKIRTCHSSTTPEEWVQYFYDRLIIDDIEVFDNSDLTVEQATLEIDRKQ